MWQWIWLAFSRESSGKHLPDCSRHAFKSMISPRPLHFRKLLGFPFNKKRQNTAKMLYSSKLIILLTCSCKFFDDSATHLIVYHVVHRMLERLENNMHSIGCLYLLPRLKLLNVWFKPFIIYYRQVFIVLQRYNHPRLCHLVHKQKNNNWNTARQNQPNQHGHASILISTGS